MLDFIVIMRVGDKMKNIYILGVARTGKSTLAQMIKKHFPEYNLISMDAIRNAFSETMPELNMKNRSSETRRDLLPKFICEFAFWNKEISKEKNGTIIEGGIITLSQIKGCVKSGDIVICLGHGNLGINEIVKNIKEYDKEDDYTYDWSEDKIVNHFNDICAMDESNKLICTDNKYMYIDSSFNRAEKFDEVIKTLQTK